MNQKTLWVKAKEIMERTGWDAEGMRRARNHGWIKFKVEEGAFFYDLRSIPSEFLKQTA